MEFTQRTEFESYVFNAEHTVDVLVTLKAPRSEEETNRSEICLSAALDRSGSMSGRKLDLVKRTMQFVTRQLGEDDKLGLVTYESGVQEVLPLTVMQTDGKQKGETAIKKVVSGGSTNLSGGLFRSVQQVQDSLEEDDHGNPGPVRAVLLLTDGLANHGIVDPDQLAQTLKTMIERGPPIKIHTFGYGSDHNSQLLEKLSDIGEGNYYFIEKDDDVPASFADALGGLVSVIIQNTVLDITLADPSAKIEKVFTGMKMTNDDDHYNIQSSDLYSEERKDIMVRLKLPVRETPIDAEALLNVKLSYFDVASAGTVNHEAVVCVKRPEVAPENQQADEDFLDQRLRIDVAEAFEDALQMGMAGNYAAANHRFMNIRCRAAQAPSTFYQAYALEELKEAAELCAEPMEFQRVGGSALRQKRQAHRVQRSAGIFMNAEQRLQARQGTAFVMGEATPTPVLPPVQEPSTESQEEAAKPQRNRGLFTLFSRKAGKGDKPSETTEKQ